MGAEASTSADGDPSFDDVLAQYDAALAALRREHQAQQETAASAMEEAKQKHNDELSALRAELVQANSAHSKMRQQLSAATKRAEDVAAEAANAVAARDEWQALYMQEAAP